MLFAWSRKTGRDTAPHDAPESTRRCECASRVAIASKAVRPPIRPNNNAIGIKNAMSASDGSNLTATLEPVVFMKLTPSKPETVHLRHVQPVVKCPEIHVIDRSAPGDTVPRVRRRNTSLAVNALLPKAVIRRQLQFERQNLPSDGNAASRLPVPRHQDAAATDILRIQSVAQPSAGDVT